MDLEFLLTFFKAGTKDQVQLGEDKGLLYDVLSVFKKKDNRVVRKEAIFCLSNFACSLRGRKSVDVRSHLSYIQLILFKKFAFEEWLQPISEMISYESDKSLQYLVLALREILKILRKNPSRLSLFISLCDKFEIPLKIEQLQLHKEPEIYMEAGLFLSLFYKCYDKCTASSTENKD